MDLSSQYSSGLSERCQSWEDDDGKEYTNFWNVHGNCFHVDLGRKIVEKFSAKNAAFVSHKALANALFDSHVNHWEGRKDDEDIVPTPEAVKNLTRINYKKQLHINPAGFGVVICKEYAKRNEEVIKSYPQINPVPNLIVLDERGVNIGDHWHYHRFKEFIEESEKSGWELYLLSDQHDILFMKR